MKLIISLILLYFTLINVYFYTKERKKILGFKSWFQYFYSLFILILFFVIFIIFFRLLSFFKESRIIDLKYYFTNYNIIFLFIIILFFFSLRKLIFLLAKLSFFKLHYFYLSPSNNDYCIYYYNFYFNFLSKKCIKYYNYLYWFDKLMLLILIFFFFKDFIRNNFILTDTLVFLKFFGFFKFCFIIIRFISEKQNLLLDYYLFNLYYIDGVRIDEGFFAETLSSRVADINDYEDNVIKSY